MTDEMMQANQVPLVEQLRSVPANAHLAINTPNPLGHDTQHLAIGEMCHRAAARLAALEAELAVERERRDAAEIALRMIRIDAAWAIDTQQQVLNHFARFKD